MDFTPSLNFVPKIGSVISLRFHWISDSLFHLSPPCNNVPLFLLNCRYKTAFTPVAFTTLNILWFYQNIIEVSVIERPTMSVSLQQQETEAVHCHSLREQSPNLPHKFKDGKRGVHFPLPTAKRH